MRRSGYGIDDGVFYLLQDHLKSSSSFVNQSGATLTNNYYYPYGGNRAQGAPGAFSNLTTKRFTGQYHESSLPGGEGLSYYGARWYDAKLGRFLSADTIVPGPANPQAFNRYSYVFNNPLRFVDPSGHYPCVGVSQCIRDPGNPFYAGNANGGTSPSVYPAISACGIYDYACIGAKSTSFYQTHQNYNAVLDPYLNADSRYDYALGQLANFYQSQGESNRALQAFLMRSGVEYVVDQETVNTTYTTAASAGFFGISARSVYLRVRYWVSGDRRSYPLWKGSFLEGRVLNKLGYSKNTTTVTGYHRGQAVPTIPDILDHSRRVVGDIKDEANISLTPQLSAQIDWARANQYSYELHVRPNSRLSGPLQNAITNINGRVITDVK